MFSFNKMNASQHGFSLIELIAVIVIMGVLATASVKFIVLGTEIYLEANDRQSTLSKSRFVIERMTREIRSAIPNSVRVSANEACIEFIPIKASGAYRDDSSAIEPPVDPESGTTMDVVSWSGTYNSGDRLYIYPNNTSQLYSPSSNRYANIVSASGTSPELTITFNSIVSYEEHSPKRRYYTAYNPVNFCLIENETEYDMYRFVSTDFFENQSVPADKTEVINLGGVLMAEGLSNDLSNGDSHPFDISGTTLNSNSVVNLYLEFNANTDENMFFNHEVHIPNVP